jgi:PAS domain S-box-containing protein
MIDTLSDQERKVIELAAEGMTDKGIAGTLGISPATVVTYWGRIRAKLGLHSRPELVGCFVTFRIQTDMNRLQKEMEERVVQEKELMNEVQKLMAVLNMAPEALLIVSPDGIIQSGNQEAASLLGCLTEDFPGLGVGRFIPPEIHVIHRTYREKYMQDPRKLAIGHDKGVEFMNYKGERMVGTVTLNVARTPAGESVIVVLKPHKVALPEAPHVRALQA